MHVSTEGYSRRLVYNYYRTYDPATGRYLESDPIGLAAGLNTYAYVGNMPTAQVDSFGLLPDDYYAAEDAIRNAFPDYGLAVPNKIKIGLPAHMEAFGNYGNTNYPWDRPQEVAVTERFFDDCISDDQARLLLNAYVHETLHYNSSILDWLSLRFLQDDQAMGSGNGRGDRIHDAIYERANDITNDLFDQYNMDRKRRNRDFLGSIGDEWTPDSCRCAN